MENPKVSIIIGCYNIAHFLKIGRLENIYRQTYSNWELILVDDGSTDETAGLLDAAATDDSRIKVIHKDNGGLGSARNAGLDVATGEYVWSYDLDDEIEANLLEKLCEIAEETMAEVVCFGYVEHDNRLGTNTICEFERISCHSNEGVRDIYLDHLLLKFNNGFFWNKLYQRNFIEKNHLRFGNERIQQDEVFNLRVYKCLKYLEVVPGTFYHYYIYDKGNTRSRFIPDRYEIYKSVYGHFCELKDYWKLKDERLVKYLNNRLYANVNDLLRYNLVHPNCTWNRTEKKAEKERVLRDSDFVDAIEFKKKESIGIENRLFLYAYHHQSVFIICVLNFMFKVLRGIKNIFK